MKKRVAVFPAGSEIGLEINRALKYSTHFEVYGFTSVADHSAYVYKNYVEGLPYYTKPDFIEKLNQVLEKYQIDFLYPALDDLLLYLTEHEDEIHAKVVTSDLNTIQICRSKEKTYDFFADCEFVPKSYHSIEEIEEYPVFIKPDIGQGSQGAKLIHNQKELEYALEENRKIVICEYLSGEEYTIDCFTDNKGKLIVSKMRNRNRVRTGISVNSRLLPMSEEVNKIAEKINERLRLRGAWFFQLKRGEKGEFRLLEIAPRIAGTMGLSRNTGVNYPLLTLFTAMGRDISIIHNDYGLEVDRAFISRFKTDIQYDTVYVDLDDTIVLGEKVNTFLMMFLYQCVNEKKKIILITKHLRVVKDTLEHNRISLKLFDEIIHLKDEDKKSAHMTEEKAIFIDDSFAERKDVADHCKIPVFDLSEVEALIDWK